MPYHLPSFCIKHQPLFLLLFQIFAVLINIVYKVIECVKRRRRRKKREKWSGWYCWQKIESTYDEMLLLNLSGESNNKSISLHLCSLCFRHPFHPLFLLFFSSSPSIYTNNLFNFTFSCWGNFYKRKSGGTYHIIILSFFFFPFVVQERTSVHCIILCIRSDYGQPFYWMSYCSLICSTSIDKLSVWTYFWISISIYA